MFNEELPRGSEPPSAAGRDAPVDTPSLDTVEEPRRARGRRPDPLLRGKLLGAAATAFMERGYSGTSIDDIASVLGVTKGSVYHHYASKSEIYFAVQEAAMQRIDAQVRAIYESDAGPQEKLYRMANAHAAAIMSDFAAAKVGVQGLERSLMKAAGVEARRGLRRNLRMRKDYEAMFRNVIAAGIAIGVFREGPVGLMSMGSLGTLNWITLWFNPHRSNTQTHMAQIAEQLARMVVQALRP